MGSDVFDWFAVLFAVLFGVEFAGADSLAVSDDCRQPPLVAASATKSVRRETIVVLCDMTSC